MSKLLRRFEILLPKRFNNQQEVPEELVAETLLNLELKFGAVSSETQTIRGIWQHEGHTHRDELIRVFIEVDDTPENRRFFEEFKERLKVRFQQLDIWITTHPIEVV
jgi:hypothetical protein